MFPLIGIVGLARSGKNHIGKLLLKHKGFLPWAYANPLKMNLYAKNDTWTLQQIFGDGDKPEELRRELQLEGTERGRYAHRQDMWVRALEAFLYIAEEWSPKGVVICDVRFPDELEYLRSKGALLLTVVRNGSGLHDETGEHVSESFVASMETDGIIDNTGFPSDEELMLQLTPYLNKLGV